MKKFLLLVVLVIGIVGCSDTNEEPNTTTASMPEKMPDDFGFAVQFGVDKKNEINTFEETVTKDLIQNGTITTSITLTEKEMQQIYEKMKDVHIVEEKKLIPEPIDGEICYQQPHEEDEWKIRVNGETIHHSVSGAYCDSTADASELFELRNYIFDIVKRKDTYKDLPEAVGGYD